MHLHLYPDQEELNRDNTLNEVEEYFQYRVELKPFMTVGNEFITDKREVDVKLVNGTNKNRELVFIPDTCKQVPG